MIAVCVENWSEVKIDSEYMRYLILHEEYTTYFEKINHDTFVSMFGCTPKEQFLESYNYWKKEVLDFEIVDAVFSWISEEHLIENWERWSLSKQELKNKIETTFTNIKKEQGVF